MLKIRFSFFEIVDFFPRLYFERTLRELCALTNCYVQTVVVDDDILIMAPETHPTYISASSAGFQALTFGHHRNTKCPRLQYANSL